MFYRPKNKQLLVSASLCILYATSFQTNRENKQWVITKKYNSEKLFWRLKKKWFGFLRNKDWSLFYIFYDFIFISFHVLVFLLFHRFYLSQNCYFFFTIFVLPFPHNLWNFIHTVSIDRNDVLNLGL